MSLLEVVLAIAILALIATSATTTLSYLYTSQVRGQQRIAASELASRLTLMFLDDPHTLPASSLPISSAHDEYRYELEKAPVELLPAPHVRDLLARNLRSPSPISFDRLEQITVRVWLSEGSGGSRGFDPDVPSAIIVRLYDPQYFNRNPDSGIRLFEDPARQQEMINQILGNTG